MKKRSVHSRHKLAVSAVVRPEMDPISPVQAMAAIGPVVYAIRLLDGAVKIGWTSDLSQRKRTWRIAGNEGILAVMPGTLDDEQEIHARLSDHLMYGREYYKQTPEILAEVNRLRASVGMDALMSLA